MFWKKKKKNTHAIKSLKNLCFGSVALLFQFSYTYFSSQNEQKCYMIFWLIFPLGSYKELSQVVLISIRYFC